MTGLLWSEGIAFAWLAGAAETHLASGPLLAALFAGAAAFVYGGIYLVVFAAVYPVLPRPRWLMAAACWVLLEEARARFLGGAPWALLGHSQHGALPLAQLAELGGVAGLSFLVVLPSAALAERGRERRIGLILWGAALFAGLLFGSRRIDAWSETLAAPGVGMRLVAVSGLADAPDPLRAYADASAQAADADLTVWPESALPGYLQESPAVLRSVADVARGRGWLLLGARHYEGSGAARRYLNSALLLDPDGRPHGVYAKSKLVPFAERSPWPFPSLVARPYAAGAEEPAPLQAGALRVGVLICWESVFDEPARSYARRGVDVLVNLTSDRDLGAGASQHLAFSRFRAIETRRWLVRVSGTGSTLGIDPLGRVHADPALVIAAIDAPLTLAVRAGWLVPVASALLLLAGFIAANRRSYRGANLGS